jgi:hypothetical protein
MAIQANAWVRLEPSFVEPEILMQYSQPSGFVDVMADEQLRVRMAGDDLLVYMKQLNVRTRIAAGTASFDELPGVDIAASYMSTPSYLLKARAEWDHHDVQAGSRWGFSVPEAYRKGIQQANFQFARDGFFYGFSPEFGEGLQNASGVVATNLPPDSNGNASVQTYDNGEMAFYLSSIILGIKTRTLQLGIGKKFTIIGPQRTLGLFEYNVVQLVQFQRTGAGTASTKETMEAIVQGNGDKVTWCYDDTLIGKGDGGSDLVFVAMPEVDVPREQKVNTNVFASLMPANKVCVTQYCDKAAPTEIISPLPGGGTDMVTEWRLTSGYAPRGIAVTAISMPY